MAFAKSPGIASALALAAALVWGCGDSAAPPPAVPSGDCRDAEVNAAVGGDWTISGSGRREGCDDPARDGEFRLQAVRPLEVSQDPDPEEPSADRLSSRAGAGEEGEFALAGRVAGNCVDFDVSREIDGESFTMRFRGELAGSRLVGGFAGTAPGGCRTEGELQIDLDR